MIGLCYIIICLCMMAIVYNYAIFPRWIIAKNQLPKQYTTLTDAHLPHISILMALHNEEKVIAEKLHSIFDSDYPLDKIRVYIGIDYSTDQTENIVDIWSQKFSQILFYQTAERTGKPAIINHLAQWTIQQQGGNQLFVLTDANVMFDTSMLRLLASQNHSASDIGLVGARVLFKTLHSEGVAMTENKYNNQELDIKYAEGELYGTMMGPFGACFSMRASLWQPVPAGFLVDDFWTNSSVLSQNYRTMLCSEAIAYETIDGNAAVEYRRKVRMSTGNFQNLFYFKSLWRSSRRGLSFCYWSHKILRWLTPFFLLIMYILFWGIFAYTGEPKLLMIVVHLVLLLIVLDFIFDKSAFRLNILRDLRHFAMMNLAILHGFFNYIFHKSSAFWQPTERH